MYVWMCIFLLLTKMIWIFRTSQWTTVSVQLVTRCALYYLQYYFWEYFEYVHAKCKWICCKSFFINTCYYHNFIIKCKFDWVIPMTPIFGLNRIGSWSGNHWGVVRRHKGREVRSRPSLYTMCASRARCFEIHSWRISFDWLSHEK